jgi:hypothetical protein
MAKGVIDVGIVKCKSAEGVQACSRALQDPYKYLLALFKDEATKTALLERISFVEIKSFDVTFDKIEFKKMKLVNGGFTARWMSRFILSVAKTVINKFKYYKNSAQYAASRMAFFGVSERIERAVRYFHFGCPVPPPSPRPPMVGGEPYRPDSGDQESGNLSRSSSTESYYSATSEERE